MDVVHAVRSPIVDANVIYLARILLTQYQSSLSVDELTTRMCWMALQRRDIANLLRERIV